LGHSDEDKAIFAIGLAVIDQFDRPRVAENAARLFKRDAMLPRIRGRLVIIPFELFIGQYIRPTRSFSRCRGAQRVGRGLPGLQPQKLAAGCHRRDRAG